MLIDLDPQHFWLVALDNASAHRTTAIETFAALSRGYRLLVDVFGYPTVDATRFARNGIVACYAEPDVKRRLLEEFDTWMKQHAQS